MTAALNYREFLESKFRFERDAGFVVPADAVNPICKPHQRDIILWAVRKGRAAIFAAFGLGKTVMELETLRLIGDREGGRQLIVCPLGVRQEFARNAAMLGTPAPRFVRRSDEVDGAGCYITNYESVRDGKLDPSLFNAVALDEASVLRSYGSKTYQSFLTLFQACAYRFVATATPSPNRYKELIHYAAFLGVMDSGQALTRFFQRDSTQANNLTLYPHMVREFFAWLHAWAVFVQRPSDLGYSDDGYDLPPLRVHYHEIAAAVPVGKFDRDGQAKLISDAALSLKDASDEKRESITARVAKAVEIATSIGDGHVILWHHREDERHAIQAAVPEAVSVWGSQDLDEREDRILGFADGAFRILSTKPEIAGSGCNFQRHCHTAVFVGIDYQFNDFLQAIHRLYRFQQQHPVDIHVIHTDAEREILKALQAKWAEDAELRREMAALIREYGLSQFGVERELARTIGVTRAAQCGDGWTSVHNDCVDEYRRLESDRFGMLLTSIPFGNHYEYSASYNDFGHNDDNARFFAQMDYLTPELLRTLKPGRILAVHTKDRIRFGNVTGDGFPTVEPFHADCIAHYRRHGFRYVGMITVVTDVVRENNQTYRLGWTECCKDGTKMGVGSPEYVLLFRKLPSDTSKGYADERVTKSKDEYTRARWQLDAHAFWRSSGNRMPTAEELSALSPDSLASLYEKYSAATVYDFAEHVAIGQALDDRGALPATFMCLAPASHHPDVWHNVTRMLTLNGEQTRRGLENHICPLQFDIVDRLIERYTNPGDEIGDPFGGLATTAVRAIKLGRRGHVTELNGAYWSDGLRYLRAAEEMASIPTLFDVIGDDSDLEFAASSPAPTADFPGRNGPVSGETEAK